MSAVAELAEDRVVEGVYAVARKQRLRTRGGSPYLALELVDPSGRIEGRVWQDVDLLDARFDEGDAEELPYGDTSFDLVVSLIGAMFAPRPERVAAELVRVCRPGGRIVMGNCGPPRASSAGCSRSSASTCRPRP